MRIYIGIAPVKQEFSVCHLTLKLIPVPNKTMLVVHKVKCFLQQTELYINKLSKVQWSVNDAFGKDHLDDVLAGKK